MEPPFDQGSVSRSIRTLDSKFSNQARNQNWMTRSQAMVLDASRLEALLESAQLLHSSLNLDELLQHLLRTVMGRMLAGRGLIAIEEGGVMRFALGRGIRQLAVGDHCDEQIARQAGVELLFHIGNATRPLGLLGIAPPPGREPDLAELDFVKALLGIAASGIVNARAHAETSRLNQMLGQKVQELRTLLDLARGFSGFLEPDQVAQLLGLTIAGRWAVRKYAITAWREGHLLILRQKGLSLPDLKGYRQELANLPEAMIVDELPDGEFKADLQAQQATLLFPLRSSNETIGLVVIGPRPQKLSYTEADLDFGIGIAAQAAVAFENAWYLRETVEKKRLEQELNLAASIQANLFPASLPSLSGYDFAAHNRAALRCGGDYYDALPIAETGDREPHLLCVADVSGKGLPASLLMSNLQATLRALLGSLPSLVDLAARTNELLYATTPSNKYVTAILVAIDPVTGACHYVNAGHDGGLLLRKDGEVEFLRSTSTPLGLMAGMPYLDAQIELQPDDLLVLYSDGVPEAYNLKEEEWGEERLVACLKECRDQSAAQITAKVFEAIDAYAGTAPQHDDITLMVLKRTN
jgi:sigma-B regulation protein RsbU (phosphoserine phosphatase)